MRTVHPIAPAIRARAAAPKLHSIIPGYVDEEQLRPFAPARADLALVEHLDDATEFPYQGLQLLRVPDPR
eukprot:15843092-Heterocapsa_arctica.AAC.1